MIVVVCHRDPDASNEHVAFGGMVTFVDLDYGRADLRDRDEFEEWYSAHRSQACELAASLTPGGLTAAAHIRDSLEEARERYGHLS